MYSYWNSDKPEFLCVYNTKRNKYNCFKIKLKKRKWLKFENWPLKIYIRIIKHYTDIDPSVNTRPRISWNNNSCNNNFKYCFNKLYYDCKHLIVLIIVECRLKALLHGKASIAILVSWSLSVYTLNQVVCFMQSLFTNYSRQNGESWQWRHYHTNWGDSPSVPLTK
jgi:hypothetical protein